MNRVFKTVAPENSEVTLGAQRLAQAAQEMRRPLIAHIIYRLDVGGLENGLVNLINRTPQYRHAVICMTDYSDFSRRITHDDVSLHALHKQEGHDVGVHWRLYRLLRQLHPDIVHTRNLAAMEGQVAAWLAGAHVRIHGEHGRDVHDLDGSSRIYQWLRRLHRPLIQRYIPLSRDLEQYLLQRVGVPARKIAQIYNGVDSARFVPATTRRAVPLEEFAPPGAVIIGAVGRMQAVKDPLNLARAFVLLLRRRPAYRNSLRMVMVGDGPLYRDVQDLLAAEGAAALAWLPGARDDIPELMQSMDIFVLPSKAEGISNTILEAMATGLPVVATRVGGNGELIEEEMTGMLVPAADPAALADAIERYAGDENLRRNHGRAGRARIERAFSIDTMVNKYVRVYETLLKQESESSRL